jgi:hypothetical protein
MLQRTDGRAAVEADYRRRLERQHDEARRHMRRFRAWASCRSVTVGAIIALAILSEKEQPADRVTLLSVPAVAAGLFMIRRRRAGRAWDRAVRAARYYEDRLACLDERWAERGDPGTRYLDADHPAALDLDLFGIGSLYQRLCAAHTQPGQDTLAKWLTASAGVDEVRARQDAVADLCGGVDLCEELAVSGAAIPAQHRLTALEQWGRLNTTVPWPGATCWLIALGPVLAIAGLLASAMTDSVLPLAAVAVHVGVAMYFHRRAAAILEPVEAAQELLPPLAHLLTRLARERFPAPRLAELIAILAHPRPAVPALRRLHRTLTMVLPATLLGCRPQMALLIDRWRRRHGHDLERWLGALGEMEALAALATYARENPEAVFPELVSEGACFVAEGLGHPLLPPERCVANDVTLAGDQRLLMVSGSNMSGKSTLLRAVGVNAVLALTGAPVRARRLRLTPLVVGATLRVQDSLRAGRSRFYAEAVRVRRLLQLADSTTPLLFLLDELFQGTNSHDRRVGAEAVLHRLLGRGAIGLVTTHDLALTSIADRLAPRAINVHFEDHGGDGALEFDYRLRSGVVPSSNGLALLRAVGIDV